MNALTSLPVVSSANDTTPALSIPEALVKFVADAQAMIDADMAKNYPNSARKVLSVEPGRRYARIVIQSEGNEFSRSCYCFVDLTNGNILKSESWKKPAKHARGNILSIKDVSKSVSTYGAHYLA